MSVISCCLSVSLTLIGMHFPFLRQFSHDIIILAVSLSFLDMFEIMLFDVVAIEKDAKDKDTALRKISYVISSQWEHFGA